MAVSLTSTDFIESVFDGQDPVSEAKTMCETLLANAVIESYRIEVV